MPQCPSCGKGFKDPTAVANHMSQPASGCNMWVDNLVSLTDNFRCHTDSNTVDSHFEMVDQMDVDTADYTGLDADLEYPVNVPPSPLQAVEQEKSQTCDYYPSAGQKFHSGPMFMDTFNADKYSSFRTTNLYYRFASHEEWELSLWLLHSSLSMRVSDSFLALAKVCLVSL
jgi:hypothetical protein